jgi:hypothetical protein
MAGTTGKTVVIAVVAGVATTFVGIATTSAIAYAQKDWSSPVGILIVAALAAVAALIPLLQKSQEKAPAAPAPVPPYPAVHSGRSPAVLYPPARPTPARVSRRVPVLVVLVILALCGGGAYGVTAVVQYAGGYVTGNEQGTERLAQRSSGTSGDLALEVTSVVVSSHFTRVTLTARNAGAVTITLPVYDNVLLISASGRTLQADTFRSKWPENVPPGHEVSGTIVFPHDLGDGAVVASLSFARVFGTQGGAVVVDGIQLNAA